MADHVIDGDVVGLKVDVDQLLLTLPTNTGWLLMMMLSTTPMVTPATVNPAVCAASAWVSESCTSSGWSVGGGVGVVGDVRVPESPRPVDGV